MDKVVPSWARLKRLAQELHSRFGERLASLAMVAGPAGTDDVLPGVRTAAGTRHDMVDRQVMGAYAAVLAGVVIAEKDLAAAEFHAHRGTLDQAQEADDRRRGEAPVCRGHLMLVGLQDLCLAGEPEDERPTHRCDMQRLVVLVENEDWSVAVEGHKAITLERELQGYVTVVALERIGITQGCVPITTSEYVVRVNNCRLLAALMIPGNGVSCLGRCCDTLSARPLPLAAHHLPLPLTQAADAGTKCGCKMRHRGTIQAHHCDREVKRAGAWPGREAGGSVAWEDGAFALLGLKPSVGTCRARSRRHDAGHRELL